CDGTAALYTAVEAETIIHTPYRRAAVDCALDGKLLVYPLVRLLVDPSDSHNDLTRGTVIVRAPIEPDQRRHWLSARGQRRPRREHKDRVSNSESTERFHRISFPYQPSRAATWAAPRA